MSGGAKLVEGIMDKLVRYIETAAGRRRIVEVLHKFTLIVGTVVSAILLMAILLRRI